MAEKLCNLRKYGGGSSEPSTLTNVKASVNDLASLDETFSVSAGDIFVFAIRTDSTGNNNLSFTGATVLSKSVTIGQTYAGYLVMCLIKTTSSTLRIQCSYMNLYNLSKLT